ncbi:P27 family phage terminase small subunit, partial [Acidobacteria bacterium AH-259-D05]|nr:P27 family phage terminase small subunit [Acidobacteria bacterium AH-259-D05]
CRREAWNSRRREKRGTPEPGQKPLKVVPMRRRSLRESKPDLKPETASWYAWVLSTWELDYTERKLLLLAGQSWDRYRQAKRILDEEGLTFATRGKKPTIRPEVAVEKDSRTAFCRLIGQLGLESAGEPGEENHHGEATESKL